MILATGIPKSGTHLLCRHLEQQGLVWRPGCVVTRQRSDRLIMKIRAKGGDPKDVDPSFDYGPEYVIRGHVRWFEGFEGFDAVHFIWRHPLDCLASSMKARGTDTATELRNFGGLGIDFATVLETYRPWLERATVHRFEELVLKGYAPTFTGAGPTADRSIVDMAELEKLKVRWT